MSKLDKEQVIAAFTEAYTAVNGKAPIIEAKGGWYNVDGGKNIRLAGLDAMISELAPTTPTIEAKIAVDKPRKIPQEKPVTEKKVTTKSVTKKVKKSDFSVKAFWTKKVLERNSLSKLPR